MTKQEYQKALSELNKDRQKIHKLYQRGLENIHLKEMNSYIGKYFKY